MDDGVMRDTEYDLMQTRQILEPMFGKEKVSVAGHAIMRIEAHLNDDFFPESEPWNPMRSWAVY